MDGFVCLPAELCRFSWTLYASSGWSVVHLCKDAWGNVCVGGIGTAPHPTIPGQNVFSWGADDSPLM